MLRQLIGVFAFLLAFGCLIAQDTDQEVLAADDECTSTQGAGESCGLHALQLKAKGSVALTAGEESQSASASKVRARAAYLHGNWSKDHKDFIFSPSKDFLYTWTAPAGKKINVSATEAIKYGFPLSVLQVLNHCSHGPLASALQEARKTGQLRIHLVGISGGLEPMMDWDKFLMGPLSSRQESLVEAYGLPKAPFARMNVSLLFNEYENSAHFKRKGPFPEGYSEKYVAGQYHKVVKEVPHVVLALNPGFAHYPKSWWTSLRYLSSLGVPLITTGYGAALKNVYAFDRHRVKTELEGPSLKLQTPNFATTRTRVLAYTESPGGGAYFIDKNMTQTDHEDANGSTLVSKHSWSTPDQRALGSFFDTCSHTEASLLGDAAQDQLGDVEGVCSDLNGTIFLSRKAGYKVSLSMKNSFQYCDEAPPMACDANGVAMLLEPHSQDKAAALQRDTATAEFDELLKPPADLFQEVIRKSMACSLVGYRTKLQPCLEKRLEAGPKSKKDIDEGIFENMDAFFSNVEKDCGGTDQWEETKNGKVDQPLR